MQCKIIDHLDITLVFKLSFGLTSLFLIILQHILIVYSILANQIISRVIEHCIPYLFQKEAKLEGNKCQS